MRPLLASWRTSIFAVPLLIALAAYLFGYLTETQLLVTGTIVSVLGKLLGADAAQVEALKDAQAATSVVLRQAVGRQGTTDAVRAVTFEDGREG